MGFNQCFHTSTQQSPAKFCFSFRKWRKFRIKQLVTFFITIAPCPPTNASIIAKASTTALHKCTVLNFSLRVWYTLPTLWLFHITIQEPTRSHDMPRQLLWQGHCNTCRKRGDYRQCTILQADTSQIVRRFYLERFHNKLWQQLACRAAQGVCSNISLLQLIGIIERVMGVSSISCYKFSIHLWKEKDNQCQKDQSPILVLKLHLKQCRTVLPQSLKRSWLTTSSKGAQGHWEAVSFHESFCSKSQFSRGEELRNGNKNNSGLRCLTIII